MVNQFLEAAEFDRFCAEQGSGPSCSVRRMSVQVLGSFVALDDAWQTRTRSLGHGMLWSCPVSVDTGF